MVQYEKSELNQMGESTAPEVAAARHGAHSQIQAKNVQKVHVLRSLKFFFSWVRMVYEIGN